MDYDRIKVKFEIEDNFMTGEIERTKFEKDADICSAYETHLEKIIDIFVDFMVGYGFSKATILKGFEEYIGYETESDTIKQ